MLKCRDVVLQSSDYVEGNMSLRKRLAMGVHLLMCGRCRSFVRHLQVSIAYYRKLATTEISASQAAEIAARARDGL